MDFLLRQEGIILMSQGFSRSRRTIKDGVTVVDANYIQSVIVDVAGIGNKKVLAYNASTGKLEYVSVIHADGSIPMTGQSASDVKASRSLGTWYENTSTRNMIVYIVALLDAWGHMSLRIRKTSASPILHVSQFQNPVSEVTVCSVVAVVPPSWYYYATGELYDIWFWIEQYI